MERMTPYACRDAIVDEATLEIRTRARTIHSSQDRVSRCNVPIRMCDKCQTQYNLIMYNITAERHLRLGIQLAHDNQNEGERNLLASHPNALPKNNQWKTYWMKAFPILQCCGAETDVDQIDVSKLGKNAHSIRREQQQVRERWRDFFVELPSIDGCIDIEFRPQRQQLKETIPMFRLMHGCRYYFGFQRLTNRHQTKYTKSIWQLKQHSSIKLRVRVRRMWRAYARCEWLWTENNTWPHNMIIILGLNNVLFYSLVRGTTVTTTTSTSFGVFGSTYLSMCVCVCLLWVWKRTTIHFAIYLAFIRTMHKIRLLLWCAQSPGPSASLEMF